uniref:C2H2-type domain-containing protein n=1 Tax=Homalodisca liturata TaxID=320908 RepID=A0A1B6JHL6_9HEMI
MDDSNKFASGMKHNFFQQEGYNDEKPAETRKPSSYNILKPNPPPPLPGVFVFDRPNHHRNIHNIDSNFNNAIKPSASTTIDNFCGDSVLAFGKTGINGPPMHEMFGNQNEFQSQSLTMYDYSIHSDHKGLKPLQPTLQSVDCMLPSDSCVYQSLQPVSQDLFDVLPHAGPKVYQQLQTVSRNDYRVETERLPEQKIYQQLTPVSLSGNMLQKEESRIYQHPNSVNRSGTPHREFKSFSELQPVVPNYKPPDYIHSKLYQQLRKPPKKESRPHYQEDVKTYHQLRPVTVSDFESPQHSNYKQVNQYTYTNDSSRANVSVSSNKYHQLQNVGNSKLSKLHQNIQDSNVINATPSPSSHDHLNRKSPLDLQTKNTNKSHEQVNFQTNKPKIYLEPRNPSVRHQMETSGSHHRPILSNDPLYRAVTSNYEANYQEVCPLPDTQLPIKTGNKPKNSNIKLPSPYEFNLPQSNAPNKYKLPKILDPNEYDSPQHIVKTTGSVVSTQIIQNFGSPNNCIVSSTSKNSYSNNFTELTPTKQPVPLSLPKAPVCYGDAGVNNGRYREANSFFDEKKNLSSASLVSIPSSSSAFQVQSSISSNISKTADVNIDTTPLNNISTRGANRVLKKSANENHPEYKRSNLSNSQLTLNGKESEKSLSSPKAINLTCSSESSIETSKESFHPNNENYKNILCTQTVGQVMCENKNMPELNKNNLIKNNGQGSVTTVEVNREKSVESSLNNQNIDVVSSSSSVSEHNNYAHNELTLNSFIESSCVQPMPLSNDSQNPTISTQIADKCIVAENMSTKSTVLPTSTNIPPKCVVSPEENKNEFSPEKNENKLEHAAEKAVDYSMKDFSTGCKSITPLSKADDLPIDKPAVMKRKYNKRIKSPEPNENKFKKRKYKKTPRLKISKFKDLENELTVQNNTNEEIVDGFKGFDVADQISVKNKQKIILSVISIDSVAVTEDPGKHNQSVLPLKTVYPERKKRKYTRRAKLLPDDEHQTTGISHRTPASCRKEKEEDNGKELEKSSFNTSPQTEKIKYEFLDPLEEGLISDNDDEEVVFLGFDIPIEEDDTILGFDVDSTKDCLDPISSLLGQLEAASVTVECDPRSLLQAPSSTTTCLECGKIFDNHVELVEHMQWHAAIQSPHTHSFVCSVCFRGFSSSDQLAKHVKWTHEGGKKYSCPVCPKRFTTSYYVKKHVDTVHSHKQSKKGMKSMYFCAECPLKFASEALLKSHEDKVHKKALYQCDKCMKYFVKYPNLQRHKLSHTGESQGFTCAYCNQVFSSRKLLHAHWPVHSDKSIYKCEICNSTFTAVNSLKRHKMMHSEEKLFRCEICQKSFSLLSTLKTHLLIHTGARRFQCKLCGKSFNRQDVLNAHQWVHTGEKRFQCDICLEKFRWRHAVKSHKLIYHTKEKPHICEVCGKRFSHPDSFKKHAEVHSEKMFYCQVCLKAFSRPSTLKAHILIHTDLKPFFCDVCNKAFRSKSHLRNHFLVHTKEKPWLCKFCNKTYKDRIQLRRHKRVVHCKAFYKKVLPELPEDSKSIMTANEKVTFENQQLPLESTLHSEDDVSQPSEHFILLKDCHPKEGENVKDI